ncbi:MAG: gamma-glutamyltransferase family protein [Hyphomicrobiaceae bacterium]|nr:MAG: gamma-glutamyltransferase family protein [Hyphomicrobiaceae bacterium]
MLETTRAYRGMVVAPHHLAADAGLSILRDVGNAIEAMVAAAAAIAAVYPHMNGLGGDNFWLIAEPGKTPVGIDACGRSAGFASADFYRSNGARDLIPSRGPLAALTVAGAVSGWQAALEISRSWGGRMPLLRLLEDAIAHARDGFPVPRSLNENTAAKRPELEAVPGFAATFLPGGQTPGRNTRLANVPLSATLKRLAEAGLEDFYRGDLARTIAKDLGSAGSPLRLEDLQAHHAEPMAPLTLELSPGSVFNLPPPTQGIASLTLLGLFFALKKPKLDSFGYVHGLVEATKQAFLVRDALVTDPAHVTADLASFLSPAALKQRAAAIDARSALPWPAPARKGDTVWLGAVDREGRAVSFIQSLYWEFGSGLVLPSTGIVWQNRGVSFSLDAKHLNALQPRRKPFHTIQPALARLKDGRTMVYGTMGGDGQPQTQAMIFTRHVVYGQQLQEAINAPRWLLGRTWGSAVANLRIESRFSPRTIAGLREAGHDVAVVGPFEECMGHAGALVLHRGGERQGLIEGAADPRGDGRAAAF